MTNPIELPELLRHPLPDKAHDDLRVAVATVVTNLTEQMQRTTDAFLLPLSTADFAQSTLNTAVGGQAAIAAVTRQVADLATALDAQRIRIDALHIRCDTALDAVDALQERVAQLEGHHVTLPGPDAAG